MELIFEKLENGLPLEEFEVLVLEKLIDELDYWLGHEIERANKAEQKATYYERVAKLRKYK